MTRYFYEPRLDDSAPGDSGRSTREEEEPERSAEPEGSDVYGAPGDLEPERGGRGWLLIFILLLALGILALASWGVHRMAYSNMVQPLEQNYRTISLLPGQSVQPARAEMQIQIYCIARGRALAAETRRLRKPASENERLRLIARELTRAPAGKLLERPLPEGSIRGVYLVGNIVYVDLGAEFLNAKGVTPLREKLAIYALVNSLMLNNRSLLGVQLMLDGKAANTAWGWLDISSPLGPDLSVAAEAPAGATDGDS